MVEQPGLCQAWSKAPKTCPEDMFSCDVVHIISGSLCITRQQVPVPDTDLKWKTVHGGSTKGKTYRKSLKLSDTKICPKGADGMANNADPDQTAPLGTI